MKLPHVTIEYREDENYAIGKMSAWLIFGLALSLAWPMLTLLNGPALVYPNAASSTHVLNSTSMLVNALAFLCYGIFHKQMRELFSTPKRRDLIRFVAASLVAISVVLIALANSFAASAVPLLVVAGILAGLGNTVLLMSFAVSFSVCDVATASMSSGLSFAIAAVLYVLVSSFFDGMVLFCTAIAFICPFVEFFFLNRCSYQLVDHLKFQSLTIPVEAKPFALHVVIPCLLIGFCISFARTHLVESFLLVVDPMAAFTANLSATALSLVIIIGAILTQRQRLNFMARTLFPVCALALAVLVCMPQNESLAVFVFSLVYILLDCAIWVTLSDLSQRFRISAFFSFGFGYGAILLGGLVSYHLFNLGGPLSSLSLDTPAIVALVLAVLMFGLALLPNTAEILSSLKIQGSCPALAADDLELDMLHDPQYPTAAASGKALEQESTGAEPASAAAETETETGASEAQADAQQPEEEPSPTPALDELDELDNKKSLQARARSEKPGRFKRKCAKVAETYLLSRKETEVLFLLAKGRNAAAIQEALYIAAGTANTHMRHIYRKLDVHSQQELIELVEATEVEDEPLSPVD